MFESAEGLRVPATRQKSTELLNACSALAGPICGRENPPAATICARVIVVFGSEKASRLSHVAACDSDVRRRAAKRLKPQLLRFMMSPLQTMNAASSG
jgi:hypothetical protein